MGVLLQAPKVRFFDSDGNPLVGGKLFSFRAGTTTPLATYSDNEVTPNANPVILDSNGEADVWIDSISAYKFVLKDLNDVQRWEVDNITASTLGVLGSAGAGGYSSPVTHAVTDGQSATDLAGETLDSSSYSSAYYEVEIIRGTTVFANGPLAFQFVNGTARVILGGLLTNLAHGVTFSPSQTDGVAQLRAALDSGAGSGTIKLSRKLFTA